MNPKRLVIGIFLICFALLGTLLASPARSQETTSKPIVVKAKTVRPPKQKIETFKGQVIRMNTVSIIVRDPKNSYIVRTFTFSPELTKKLQALMDRGGYQPGDNVTISYEAGSTVAQSIKGKASKAF